MKKLHASIYKVKPNGSKGATLFEGTIGCGGEITYKEFSEIKDKYIAVYGCNRVGFGIELK